uniref:Uncharacterized protein n=1 Tax=Branchiostoma floridae TaxID=7739 RepID=C3YUW0_BRAFL|eukprot:XP_002599999.1 hypothetical protein BRAFLDRAFT_74118 [Branchiostoma floridae]
MTQTHDLPTLTITAPFGPPQPHTSHITTSAASQSLGEESGVGVGESSRVVNEGWAIRTVKGGHGMSDKMKTYLTHIFNRGTKSGQKADGVAQEMQHVRGADGKRLFQPSEWRTVKQITSYFARLSAAQRQQESTKSVVTDMEAIDEASEWQALRKTVYTSIDNSHPVMFEDIN